MKKQKYVMLFAAFLLFGCQYHEFYYDEDVLNADNGTAAESTTAADGADRASTAAQTEAAKSSPSEAAAAKEVEAKQPQQPTEKLVYDSAYDRFLENVVIKARTENDITYEYKDVRVDELAPLASRYCKEHGNRTAVLRSVILYKNYARRATFDCLRLQ